MPRFFANGCFRCGTHWKSKKKQRKIHRDRYIGSLTNTISASWRCDSGWRRRNSESSSATWWNRCQIPGPHAIPVLTRLPNHERSFIHRSQLHIRLLQRRMVLYPKGGARNLLQDLSDQWSLRSPTQTHDGCEDCENPRNGRSRSESGIGWSFVFDWNIQRNWSSQQTNPWCIVWNLWSSWMLYSVGSKFEWWM